MLRYLNIVPDRPRVGNWTTPRAARDRLPAEEQAFRTGQQALRRMIRDVSQVSRRILELRRQAAEEQAAEDRATEARATAGGSANVPDSLQAYLEAIARHWPDREFVFSLLGEGQSPGWALQWTSPPQPIRDVLTGVETPPVRYPVTLRISINGDASVVVEPPTEPPGFPAGEHVHPHVSDGYFCIQGTTRRRIERAVAEGDTVTPILQVEALLAHYQSTADGGPYQSLQGWCQAWPAMMPSNPPPSWFPQRLALDVFHDSIQMFVVDGRRNHPTGWTIPCASCREAIHGGERIAVGFHYAPFRPPRRDECIRLLRAYHPGCLSLSLSHSHVNFSGTFLSQSFWQFASQAGIVWAPGVLQEIPTIVEDPAESGNLRFLTPSALRATLSALPPLRAPQILPPSEDDSPSSPSSSEEPLPPLPVTIRLPWSASVPDINQLTDPSETPTP